GWAQWRCSSADTMRLGLGRVAAHEALALVDELGPIRSGQSLERQQLEDRLLRTAGDPPAPGDQAVDEEGRPYLSREDDRPPIGVRQDPCPLGRGVTEDRGVEPRE